MTGDLMFDISDNIMVMNDQSLRLKSSRDDNPTSSSTHMTVGRNADGDPTTNIYHCPTSSTARMGCQHGVQMMSKTNYYKIRLTLGLKLSKKSSSDVETLQNKVNALEGSVIDATWTFESDDRIPRNGEFALRAAGSAVTSAWICC